MDHQPGAERCSAPAFLFLSVVRMYSKKSKISQAVYEFALPVCFTLVSSFDGELNAVYLFAIFSLFYCIPLIHTSYKLTKGTKCSVKTCVLHDLLYVLLPFCVSAVVTDVLVSFFAGAQSWSGMTSFIFILSSVLLTLVFWIKYFIDIKFNNRP